MTIRYTTVSSPLGWLLAAATDRGLCNVSFGSSIAALETELAQQHPDATLQRDEVALQPWVDRLLRHLEGREPSLDLPTDVPATSLQQRVWEALRAIPYGSTRSYGEVARAIDPPPTAQEVGQACASNPLALVVPCHRVVRADGGLAGYRWGVNRKRHLLIREGAVVAV